jgi:hypothetical protein
MLEVDVLQPFGRVAQRLLEQGGGHGVVPAVVSNALLFKELENNTPYPQKVGKNRSQHSISFVGTMPLNHHLKN